MNQKFTYRDKRILRNELLLGADLAETYYKYVDLGFDKVKVAKVISLAPSKVFIDSHRFFLILFKSILVIISILAVANFLFSGHFEDPVFIGFLVFILSLIVIQVYLIYKNFYQGFLLVVISYLQSAIKDISQFLNLSSFIDFFGLSIGLYFLLSSIYIIKKMFPYTSFFGSPKMEGDTYLFLVNKVRNEMLN